MFTSFDKAIVSAIAGGVLTLFANGGIRADMTVEQAVTALVGAVISGAATYFVKNKD